LATAQNKGQLNVIHDQLRSSLAISSFVHLKFRKASHLLQCEWKEEALKPRLGNHRICSQTNLRKHSKAFVSFLTTTIMSSNHTNASSNSGSQGTDYTITSSGTNSQVCVELINDGLEGDAYPLSLFRATTTATASRARAAGTTIPTSEPSRSL
jgi:hypothetical protein